MARPQVEDGHTKIANEIMDALMRTNFSAYESRILNCILRKTYGWNKKSDRISYSQFEEATGMERRHIGRTIKILIARRMITCQGEGQQLEYSLQKDYEQWLDIGRKDIEKPLPNGAIDNLGSTITQRGNSEADMNHCPTGAEPLPNGDEPLPNGATKPLPNGANTKARKHITKALYKSKYMPKQKFGELSNILLTTEEHQKLVGRFGAQGATDWIEELSLAKASKGYKSISDYATILAWQRRDMKLRGQSQSKKGIKPIQSLNVQVIT